MPKKPTNNYDLKKIEDEFNRRALNNENPKLADVFKSFGFDPRTANTWINRNAFKLLKLKLK